MGQGLLLTGPLRPRAGKMIGKPGDSTISVTLLQLLEASM